MLTASGQAANFYAVFNIWKRVITLSVRQPFMAVRLTCLV